MLNWTWPYLFLLAPLPLLVRLLTSQLSTSTGAIRVPFYNSLDQLDNRGMPQAKSRLPRAVLAWLVWGALLCAAAGPLWVGDAVNLPQERRDLMLAVDISLSMREEDMLHNGKYYNRISAVKQVVGEFIEQRTGDRLGLILFGEQGYLQTPLTFDSKTVKQQLEEAQLGFAGNATAIGDAIGLAIKRLRGRPAESRILILLTDGANTSGTEPLDAVEIAKEAGIRIHTIGVGADSKITRGIFGGQRRVNPSRDLDEDTLKSIARITNGKYFRARDPKELQSIYADIDRLEPIPEDQTFRPTRSLAHWAIIVALILSALLAIMTRKGL